MNRFERQNKNKTKGFRLRKNNNYYGTQRTNGCEKNNMRTHLNYHYMNKCERTNDQMWEIYEEQVN